jgi:hypothetical protein
MTATMRAVVLDAPGPPEALRIRELPVPEPRPGWVLIRVKAFGINRSELHTRLGLAQGVSFPRVLGIEATGVVAAAPGGEFEEGQQVAAMMGGMRCEGLDPGLCLLVPGACYGDRENQRGGGEKQHAQNAGPASVLCHVDPEGGDRQRARNCEPRVGSEHCECQRHQEEQTEYQDRSGWVVAGARGDGQCCGEREPGEPAMVWLSPAVGEPQGDEADHGHDH